MLVVLETMGCGRSKQQSPGSSSKQDKGSSNGSHSKATGKKRKSKDDKKENKVPNSKNKSGGGGAGSGPIEDGLSPVLGGSNLLKVPANVNGSQPVTHNVNVEYPHCKTSPGEKNSPPSKELKEFSSGRQNIRVTSSQLEFFRMLDEKIEKGCDYASEEAVNLCTP